MKLSGGLTELNYRANPVVDEDMLFTLKLSGNATRKVLEELREVLWDRKSVEVEVSHFEDGVLMCSIEMKRDC